LTAARAAADRAIRDLRPPKPFVDPWRAHGTAVDEERRPDGSVERALTVFLAGSECPFSCSFCDLWRYTIDGPTPAGAIPGQLRAALSDDPGRADRLKLYNASNFFDARAVPTADWPAIARLAAPFGGVTVESHASTVGPRVLDFSRMLEGRLEVAMGLETIHPEAMPRLNKRLDVAGFDRAAGFLAEHQVALRVFVLVGAPHVPAAESVEWAVRTTRHAAAHGAAMVALIPVRDGNGELDRLAAAGEFTAPRLADLEDALDACLDLPRTVVTADLWDAARFASCDACATPRIERMRRINLTGRPEPRVSCGRCGAA
jgi:uncharacterized Fe-S cluster-containing MiaB family protein